MKENEKEFLAQVGVGWFSVRLSDGTIWRLARSTGGSRTGAKSYMKKINATRAERCVSRGHLKIWFTVGIRKRMAIYAHRIVWMVANQRDIPEGLEINHKDCNAKNNHPKNLEIVTRQQNTAHAGKMGLLGKKPQCGEQNACAKLITEQVLSIRALCRSKEMAQSRIAALFNVTQATISAIHCRKSWKHLIG